MRVHQTCSSLTAHLSVLQWYQNSNVMLLNVGPTWTTTQNELETVLLSSGQVIWCNLYLYVKFSNSPKQAGSSTLPAGTSVGMLPSPGDNSTTWHYQNNLLGSILGVYQYWMVTHLVPEFVPSPCPLHYNEESHKVLEEEVPSATCAVVGESHGRELTPLSFCWAVEWVQRACRGDSGSNRELCLSS